MSDDIIRALTAQNERLMAMIEGMVKNGTGATGASDNPEKSMLNHYGQFVPEPLAVNRDGSVRPPTTLVGYMERWLNDRATDGVRDIYNEVNRFNNHIRTHATFDTLPLWQIRTSHVKALLKKMSRTHSQQTVQHVFRLIRQACDHALENHEIASNPCVGVRVPKQTTTDDAWTYLQPDEIRALLTCPDLTDEQRDAFGVAIYTGLRLGELKHLHWDDVHLSGGAPTVVVRYSNGGAAKAGKPGRTPLLPMAIAVFRRMIDRDHGGVQPSGGLVFPGHGGKPYSSSWDFGWRSRGKYTGAKDKAGITRPVRFHDLRHTAASALVSGWWDPDGDGWSIEEVCVFMRHSSTKVTQRYAHLDPRRLHARAARMAEGMNGGMSDATDEPDSNIDTQPIDFLSAADGTRTRGLRRDRATSEPMSKSLTLRHLLEIAERNGVEIVDDAGRTMTYHAG